MSALDTALVLLKAGLRPVPIKPGSKAPIGEGWGEKQHTAESLESAFGKTPGAGVGLLLGPDGGVIDIDCDGPEAADTLRRLFDGEAPPTLGWSSARGGHLLFRYDPRLAEIGKTDVKLPGLELRIGADGMQTQSNVPPTKGTDDKPRLWNEHREIAALPDEFFDRLASLIKSQRAGAERAATTTTPATKPKAGGAFIAKASDGPTPLDRCRAYLASSGFPMSIEGQNGSDALYRAACECVGGFGLSRTESWGVLLEYNQAKCEPPWSDREIEHKLDDAIKNNPVPSLKRLNAPPVGASRRSADAPGPVERPRRETQAETLIGYAREGALFRTPDGAGYVAFPVAGHVENHAVKGPGLRVLLKARFFHEEGRPPSSVSVQEAIETIEALALRDGRELPVHLRAGEDDDRVFIDLGDASWRAVEIDRDGWRAIDRPPLRFRRTAGMRPLPCPERGGRIGSLGDFINVPAGEFMLFVAWLCAALRAVGPRPVLCLIGEQGTAKSTLARLARTLTDPHRALLRSLPKDERDLMVGAVNNHVLAFDNIDKLYPWQSDALCKLATGGAHAGRKLYCDDEETFLDAMRPVILNGITDYATRGDLIDRALFLHLEPIPDDRRRTDSDFWSAFHTAAPQLFGALLDAVAGGLKELPKVRAEKPPLPRMADFALFGEAVARGLGHAPGAFLRAFGDNRKSAIETSVADNPALDAIREIAERGAPWTGSAADLLDEMRSIVGPTSGALSARAGASAASEALPARPEGVGRLIGRAAPLLRSMGVFVEQARSGRRRTITIDLLDNRPEGTVTTSGRTVTRTVIPQPDPGEQVAGIGDGMTVGDGFSGRLSANVPNGTFEEGEI